MSHSDQSGQRPGGPSRGRGGHPAGRSRGRRGPGPRPSAPPPVSHDGGPRLVAGWLEIARDGTGRLYTPESLVHPAADAVLPSHMIRQLDLRPGDVIEGEASGRAVQRVVRVNGHAPEELRDRPVFERLTAVHPDQRLTLGPRPGAITGRLLDLIAPVGRGQRGLIVSPPKAGKTTLLREIAAGLTQTEGVEIIACLVGERPEEVTELRRAIRGEVLAADLDAPNAAHARTAYLGVERGKRLVEEGRHVVILLDSLTRLARAHNLDARGGGRTLSGGMDAAALFPVRQIFGAARQAEGSGSLTILATCLIDTGSRLDDLVYEEFKGTGNMEVHLDRKLAERRLFPAINILRSGTRHEELLLDGPTLQATIRARRKLARMSPEEGLADLIAALRDHPNNLEALENL